MAVTPITLASFILSTYFVSSDDGKVLHPISHVMIIKAVNVTVFVKTDHFAVMEFVEYKPKVLSWSQSRDFVISTPQCSMVH